MPFQLFRRAWAAWRRSPADGDAADDHRPAQDIEALIASLRTQSPEERRGARVSLSDLGESPAFVEPLLRATQDADDYIRESAVSALAMYEIESRSRLRKAVLHALSSDPVASVRAAAAQVCEQRRLDEVPALLRALRDAEAEVRQAVVGALAVTGGEAALTAIHQTLRQDPSAGVRHWAAVHLGRSQDKASHQALLHALQDSDAGVRAAAVYGLAQSVEERGEAPYFGAFVAALGDADSRVRQEAAGALGLTDNPAATGPLVQALGDEVARVREEAARALGHLQVPDAADALAQRLLDDTDEEVRNSAAYALGQLRHHPPATQHLLRKLDIPGDTVAIKATVLGALGYGGDIQAAPALCAALKDPDAYIREAAIGGIGDLLLFSRNGPKEAIAALLQPALREALSDVSAQVRADACRHLASLGDPGAARALLPRLRDSDPSVREQAVNAIGSLDGANHITVIVARLSDADADVRQAAAGALRPPAGAPVPPKAITLLTDPDTNAALKVALFGALARSDAAEVLPLLIEALGDADAQIRAGAATALQTLIDPRAVAPLIARLVDDEPEVRAQVALALGAQGDDAAITPLQRLLSEDETYVRRRAAHALSLLAFDAVVPLLIDHLREQPDPQVLNVIATALVDLCESDSLRQLLSELPRRKTHAREALARALAAYDEDDDEDTDGPPPPRLPGLGTLHYE